MKSRILLVDSDNSHASALALALTAHQYFVRAVDSRGDLRSVLESELVQCDIVVFNFSADRPDDWDLLRDICERVALHLPRPAVLCLSELYQGPQLRMDVERLGARLLYEQ